MILNRQKVMSTPITSIKGHKGARVADAYEQAWQKRLEQDRIVAQTRAALQQEIQRIGDNTILTKVHSR